MGIPNFKIDLSILRKDMKPKFQIGDIVRIIRPGQIYSSYIDWVRRHGLNEELWKACNKLLSEQFHNWILNKSFVVEAIGRHSLNRRNLLCGIRSEDIIIVIDECGLVLIQRNQMLPDELFEI